MYLIFIQGQQNSIHHEQHPTTLLQIHPQLHNHQDSQLTHLQDQMQPSIQSHLNIAQEKVDHHELSDLSQEKLNESQDIIINVCSDACSNSNDSINENSQNSSLDDDTNSDNNYNRNSNKKRGKQKKKKGGKVKGTLETSVEIRNRMIGMSEAGLSTLSIALAINRSVRIHCITNWNIKIKPIYFMKL